MNNFSTIKQIAKRYLNRNVYSNLAISYRELFKKLSVCSKYIEWKYREPGYKNYKRLCGLENIYKGRRCFVIGNGPSLHQTDIRKLNGEITIASNAIFLLFEETGFRPTFWTIEDPLVAADRAADVNQHNGITKIIPNDLRNVIKPDNNTLYVNFLRQYRNFPSFSSNFKDYVYWGGTVTFLNLQLAYYLGCREIYLIGVDHNYHSPSKVDKVEGAVITSNSVDINHFHPDYFGPGYRWHDPKVERMEQAYQQAQLFMENHYATIYNATAGGKLEVFSRVDFSKIVKN